MKTARRWWPVPSTIVVGLVAVAAVVTAKATGCGRTGLDFDPTEPRGPSSTSPVLPPDDEPYVPRDLDAAVDFAVIGDYGVSSENELRVARLVVGWKPDFVITTGDNNYPSGGADTIDANIGRFYSRYIGNYKGRYGAGSQINRFWPAAGNHDWITDDLRPYLNYFTLPGNERYYDVARGLVHLFAVDSVSQEPDGTTADSVQARWLKTQLAASVSCFKVVYFHYPAYSSGNVHGSSLEMRWPYAAWGADVVMAGHEHVYERLEVDGIPYFTVGTGGAGPYAFGAVLPESRKRVTGGFGALHVTADRTSIKFEFVDVAGRTVDTFTRHKNCNPPQPATGSDR